MPTVKDGATLEAMTSPTDLVRQYRAALPLEKASTPPSAWYTDPHIAALERQAVFAGHWQPVARMDQLRRPGDFVTADIAGEPIVVIRDGGIHAFYNVCRHHGAQIAGGSGCLDRFRCPYHGWTYARDGRLIGTPAFGDAADFDRDEHGLLPVRSARWQNWVWINLNPSAVDLPQAFGRFHTALDTLNLQELQFFEQREYELDCNWKVFIDNYLDGGYHVPHIHKGLGSVLDNRAYTIEVTDSHCLQSCPISGADNATGAVRQGEMAHYYWQYPNIIVNHYQGVMDTNWVFPLAPDRCRVICDFWFSNIGEDARPYNTQSIDIADEIQREDMAICAAVQRGLNSRAYDTGRLSPAREAGEYLFHQLLYRDLLAGLSAFG